VTLGRKVDAYVKASKYFPLHHDHDIFAPVRCL
jgi:hypothetical protein